MIDVSEKVETSHGEISIGGSYQPRFEGVFTQFKNNFSSLGEIGASVSATLGGEVVIDLWGGIADTESQKPWTEKTLPVVWSSTKGATALCLHFLAFRGLLDLDAPVSEYWPEYGVSDKGRTTVTMFLNHTAGLPAIKEPVPAGSYYDWPSIIEILEDAELWWKPGQHRVITHSPRVSCAVKY